MIFKFLINSLLLGVGLAMDAFSVSLANGLNEPEMKKGRMTGVAGVFAFFQFLMPLIGWICVSKVAEKFEAFQVWIPWIALLLLGYIGIEMLRDGLKCKKCEGEEPAVGLKGLLLQGVATSIDALSVGFTISDYNGTQALLACLIIGIITFFICFSGLSIGKKAGTRLAGKAGILGGIILIVIGIEIFVGGVDLEATGKAITSFGKKEVSLYDIPIRYEDPHDRERTEVVFEDIENVAYEGLEEARACLIRMEELSREEGKLAEIKERYLTIYEEFLDIETAAVVSQIHYNRDMTKEELRRISTHNDNVYSEIAVLYDHTIRTLLKSSYGEEFRAFIGEDVAEQFEGPSPLDPDYLTELLVKESELIKEYEELIMQGAEETDSLIRIYIELTDLRKEIARQNGYEDVTLYYYEQVFNRDYTPKEAELFHAYVKEYIAPTYFQVWNNTEYADDEVGMEEITETMRTYLPRISEEMAEIFDHMLDHGMLILTEDLEVSMDSGYMTNLARYGQPVIYNAVYGDYNSITDTVHEFGHYCDFYLNGPLGVGASGEQFDLAEVASTGLVILFYDFLDEIFENARQEKADLLCNYLWMLVTGCLFDEAQQEIYAYEGELTQEVVNRIFEENFLEYGFRRSDAHLWLQVIHNFEAPFYYISYAAAGAASLEIWLTMQNEGFEDGRQMYLELLSMGSFEYSYMEVLEICGMRSFQSEEFLEELSHKVSHAALNQGRRIK